jgi:hypothetical protein
MELIQCPSTFTPSSRWERFEKMFLAGGITDCPDWQSEAVEKLSKHNKLVVFNPRRADFNVRDPNISDEQIEWEHKHLQMADIFWFWFPKETLCPITLFELGKIAAGGNRPMIVGAHPEYKRRIDVVSQLKHLRDKEDAIVYSSIDEMVTAMYQRFRTYSIVDIIGDEPIKDCPGCGCNPTDGDIDYDFIWPETRSRKVWGANCPMGSCGWSVYGDSPEHAFQKWNKRAK